MPLQSRCPEEGTSPVSLAEVAHWLTQIKTGTQLCMAVGAVPKAQGCLCLGLILIYFVSPWGMRWAMRAGRMLHPYSCPALAQLSLFEASGDRDPTASPASHSKARLGKYSPIAQLDTSLVPPLGFLPCKKLNMKGNFIFIFL